MSKPACHPATLEKLGSKDAYLIDNGDYLYLYLGNQVSDSFIYNVSNFLITLSLKTIVRFSAMQTSAISSLAALLLSP